MASSKVNYAELEADKPDSVADDDERRLFWGAKRPRAKKKPKAKK